MDRDGVLNQDSADYVKRPEEFIPIPGSLEAVARLNHAGFRVVVATNQSGLGRKLFDINMLNRIHDRLYRQLAEVGGHIEAIFFCPHLPRDRCACRKPKPGLLLEIGARLHADLGAAVMIGDKETDLAAARAAGVRPLLVRSGEGKATEARLSAEGALEGVEIHDDLAAAAERLIVARQERG